jgi:hypothetical protein
MATKPEIAKLMALFEIAFPRFELKPGAPDLYYRLLQDIDGEILSAAANQLIATATFFPAISEWRQAALDIMTAKNNIPSAEEAWEEVQTACIRIGHYKTPTFTHPLIERSVQCMGWQNICMSEEPEWMRKDFIKTYNVFLKRAEDDVKMLPGVRKLTDALEAGKDASQAMKLLTRKMSNQ